MYFLESISFVLYVVSKLGKSGVQRFKWCANWSWNKEVMAVWRQPHQVVRNFATQSPFRNCEMSCETHLWHMSAIFQPMPPSSQLRTTLQNHLQAANEVANHLQVVKSHSTCKIKVQTWKMDNSTCEIHLCTLRYLLPTKLDFFSRYFV